MSNIPSDLKYAKSHEWVRVSGDTATVGITDHAQAELTDIVFVELPAVGRQVKAGEACAVVESVKTASDIYSPVSGEIVELNKPVTDNPALVNTEPYAGGWFFKIKLSNSRRTERAALAGGLQEADWWLSCLSKLGFSDCFPVVESWIKFYERAETGNDIGKRAIALGNFYSCFFRLVCYVFATRADLVCAKNDGWHC
jgi:glycine cleavage system H protein